MSENKEDLVKHSTPKEEIEFLFSLFQLWKMIWRDYGHGSQNENEGFAKSNEQVQWSTYRRNSITYDLPDVNDNSFLYTEKKGSERFFEEKDLESYRQIGKIYAYNYKNNIAYQKEIVEDKYSSTISLLKDMDTIDIDETYSFIPYTYDGNLNKL